MSDHPGKILVLDNETYHTRPAHGSTSIRTAAEWCVAFYLAERGKETAAMHRGTLDHIALLELERLERDFVVAEIGGCQAKTQKGTPCTRNSIAGAAHCAQHGGAAEAEEWLRGLEEQRGCTVELITSAELERAYQLREGVLAALKRTKYSWLLGPLSEKEVSYLANAVLIDEPPGYYITTDDVEGAIPVQCRCDVRATRLIVDAKGCAKKEDLLPRRWQWKIHNFSMHIQGALYADIVAAVEGEQCTAFGWLAHMTEAPFAVRVFTMSDTDRELGRRAVAEGLRRWKHYYDTGDPWLGWPTELEEVERPRYIINNEMDGER